MHRQGKRLVALGLLIGGLSVLATGTATAAPTDWPTSGGIIATPFPNDWPTSGGIVTPLAKDDIWPSGGG